MPFVLGLCQLHHADVIWHNHILQICRQRAASKAQGDGAKRNRARDRAARAVPAPDANAELQPNLDVCLPSYLKMLYFDLLL